MPENSDLPITYQHVPRFQPGSRESIDYLDEHGYVVIANALTNDEAATAVSKLWDYLEALGTGINRNDPNTWDNERWPTAVHGGILPGHGIGQCDAQWYIRDVPNVRQSFAAVWDTEELLVSFDGVSLWRPWSFNPEWKTGLGGSWLHIDQHPLGRPGKQCVQGLVNLLPTTSDTTGCTSLDTSLSLVSDENFGSGTLIDRTQVKPSLISSPDVSTLAFFAISLLSIYALIVLVMAAFKPVRWVPPSLWGILFVKQRVFSAYESFHCILTSIVMPSFSVSA